MDRNTLVSDVLPPFVNILKTTRDPTEFESRSYKLLKLLGIHEIHIYQEQSGKSDGFFKIGSLAVIYDSTLREEFEEKKWMQLENYCSQLASGRLTCETGIIRVADCQKNVWVITRGKTRRLTKVDNVTLKEISVGDVIRACQTRVEKNWSEDELVNRLVSISD